MSRKIIIILGPTASGKSALAVKIAKKINGEIISADSRQVYKRLDIGTGKITKKKMRGVPHHCLDIVSPRKVFTVADFKKHAEKAIENIFAKNKIPNYCRRNGTYIFKPLWIISPCRKLSLTGNFEKNWKRKRPKRCLRYLKKLDPERAKNIDAKNPRRLIRAIEIAKTLGKVPNLEASLPSWGPLQIGIKLSDKKLKENINKRLIQRLKKGMVAEAKKLHAQGLSWNRMDELGLEYRYLAKFLKGEMSKIEMTEKLKSEIWHYAKRQMTWFKRDRRIKWIKNYNDIVKSVKTFLM